MRANQPPGVVLAVALVAAGALAAFFLSSVGAPTSALEHAEGRCDDGDASACWEAAEIARRAAGWAPRERAAHEASARRLARRACDLDVGEGCSYLAAEGYRRARGGLEPAAAHASAETRRFAERGCDLGGGDGCFTLAQILDDDDDHDAARATRTRGCDATCARCCEALAQEAAEAAARDAHRSGGGAEAAAARGAEIAALHARACALDEGNAFACARAAELLEASEPTRALELYDLACARLPRSEPCTRARRLREEGPPSPDAEILAPGVVERFAVGPLRLEPPAEHGGVRRGGGGTVVSLLSEPGCTVHWSFEAAGLPDPPDVYVIARAMRLDSLIALRIEATSAPTLGTLPARTWSLFPNVAEDALPESRVVEAITLDLGDASVLALGSFPWPARERCRAELLAEARSATRGP